jgi:hypothetical protein
MKSLVVIFFLLTLTYSGFGQISPALKAGVGYMYVFDEDASISPDYHTIKGYPTISVEKPFPIEIRLKKRMSINPGLSYNFFKDDKLKGDTQEGKDFKLNHHSVSGFVKVLYQAKLAGKTEAFIYGGGIGGVNIFTKTTGTKYVYGLNVEIPEYDNPINENGRDFFKLFYYGALVGFQPNARKYNFIKPSFEIAYYPGFVSKPLEIYPIAYNNISTIQLTVLLGFRIK